MAGDWRRVAEGAGRWGRGGGGNMAAVLEVEVGGPVERDVEEVAGGRGLRGAAQAGGPGEGERRGRCCGAGGAGGRAGPCRGGLWGVR